jgi:hypothetical protein
MGQGETPSWVQSLCEICLRTPIVISSVTQMQATPRREHDLRPGSFYQPSLSLKGTACQHQVSSWVRILLLVIRIWVVPRTLAIVTPLLLGSPSLCTVWCGSSGIQVAPPLHRGNLVKKVRG